MNDNGRVLACGHEICFGKALYYIVLLWAYLTVD